MSNQSAAMFFDSYSAEFNAIYGNERSKWNSVINSLFRKSMRLRFAKTIEECEPIQGRSVLDIGCGPGHYAIHLANSGAHKVLGIDFARGMIDLAKQTAQRSSVEDRCEFVCTDFLTLPLETPFDYSIVMGFMDYTAEPDKVIAKVLAITRFRAFFSFPVDRGILAWQRKQHYKNRCDLFLYSAEQVNELFNKQACRTIKIEKISRDFFVTVVK
jgi:2-polyprenyl-3-methyl-5-hydroxy-6-metoxy-1,4-benzoquinol methylase